MIKRFAIILFLIFSAVTPVLAESGEAGQAAPVLRFGVGARAFAMGGAYIAVVDDPTSVYWNPAGLAKLSAPALSTMHSELFSGTRYDYLGWAGAVGPGGLGVSYLSLDTPGIINTSGSDNEAATKVLYCGYGWNRGVWRMGLTAKYIDEDILGSSGTGWSLDWGLQADLTREWRLGLVLQDLANTKLSWDNDYTETIPVNYRVGLAYVKAPFLITIEAERADDFQQGHFGLEYSLNDFLKLRGGLRGNDLTAGIGLSKGAWDFDYAYCAGDLGNTYRLSLGIRLQ